MSTLKKNSADTKQRGGPRKGSGRPPGTPNKATTEFRDTVTALLAKNASKVEIWLAEVAVGTPDVTDEAGKVLKRGRDPDPYKALDLLAKLAEFAAPKLARTELVGDKGGPIQISTKEQRDAAVAAATRADG